MLFPIIIDVNECFEGSTLHDCINARCRNTNGSFECDCQSGYTKPLFGGNTCEGIVTSCTCHVAHYQNILIIPI